MQHGTDQHAQQHTPTPEPIRITEDVPPPPRSVAEEIRNARAVLAATGDYDRNSATDARDASVLLHFRLQRLLDALDAESSLAVSA